MAITIHHFRQVFFFFFFTDKQVRQEGRLCLLYEKKTRPPPHSVKTQKGSLATHVSAGLHGAAKRLNPLPVEGRWAFCPCVRCAAPEGLNRKRPPCRFQARVSTGAVSPAARGPFHWSCSRGEKQRSEALLYLEVGVGSQRREREDRGGVSLICKSHELNQSSLCVELHHLNVELAFQGLRFWFGGFFLVSTLSI